MKNIDVSIVTDPDIRRSKIKIVNERREICKNGKGGTRSGNEAR